eukprot:1160244-Pelagomonas_calceolata.AAC.9
MDHSASIHDMKNMNTSGGAEPACFGVPDGGSLRSSSGCAHATLVVCTRCGCQVGVLMPRLLCALAVQYLMEAAFEALSAGPPPKKLEDKVSVPPLYHMSAPSGASAPDSVRPHLRVTSSADLDVMDMQAQARALNPEAAAAQLHPRTLLPGSNDRGLSLHRSGRLRMLMCARAFVRAREQSSSVVLCNAVWLLPTLSEQFEMLNTTKMNTEATHFLPLTCNLEMDGRNAHEVLGLAAEHVPALCWDMSVSAAWWGVAQTECECCVDVKA